MTLERQAQLEDAEAQQDHADGADQGKNEVTQIIYDLQRVAACGIDGESGNGHESHGQRSTDEHGIGPLAISFILLLALQGVLGAFQPL